MPGARGDLAAPVPLGAAACVPADRTRVARDGMAAPAPVVALIEAHEAERGMAPDTLAPLLAGGRVPGVSVSGAAGGRSGQSLRIERAGRDPILAGCVGPTWGGPSLGLGWFGQVTCSRGWTDPSRAWSCSGAM